MSLIGHSDVHINKYPNVTYLNFADDADIDVVKIKAIPQLFYSFAYDSNKVNSLINWGASNILLNTITTHITSFINNFLRPFDKVKLLTNANMIGHIMSTKTNIAETIYDRVHISNTSCGMLRKRFISTRNINTARRLN